MKTSVRQIKFNNDNFTNLKASTRQRGITQQEQMQLRQSASIQLQRSNSMMNNNQQTKKKLTKLVQYLGKSQFMQDIVSNQMFQSTRGKRYWNQNYVNIMNDVNQSQLRMNQVLQHADSTQMKISHQIEAIGSVRQKLSEIFGDSPKSNKHKSLDQSIIEEAEVESPQKQQNKFQQPRNYIQLNKQRYEQMNKKNQKNCLTKNQQLPNDYNRATISYFSKVVKTNPNQLSVQQLVQQQRYQQQHQSYNMYQQSKLNNLVSNNDNQQQIQNNLKHYMNGTISYDNLHTHQKFIQDKIHQQPYFHTQLKPRDYFDQESSFRNQTHQNQSHIDTKDFSHLPPQVQKVIVQKNQTLMHIPQQNSNRHHHHHCTENSNSPKNKSQHHKSAKQLKKVVISHKNNKDHHTVPIPFKFKLDQHVHTEGEDQKCQKHYHSYVNDTFQKRQQASKSWMFRSNQEKAFFLKEFGKQAGNNKV